MTEMLASYLNLRAQGSGHIKACRMLAARTGLDEQTMHRIIVRAQAEEHRLAKRAA